MNNKKTKKVTIADLARMIKEDVVDIMATKEDLQNLEARMATKDDLKNLEARMATKDVLEVMLKEIRTIHEDNKYFRANISALYTDGVSYDRKINNLTVRVEKLEVKSK